MRYRSSDLGPSRRRTGSVLLEFTLIALILFALLAFTMDFGRATFSAQITTQAADHIARELAVSPMLPDQDTSDATFDPLMKKHGIYSEDFLIIDISDQPADQFLLDYLDSKGIPSGNKLLVPLMIVMDKKQNTNIPDGKKWLVYPGAMVASTTSETKFTIRIPLVKYSAGGVETVESDEKKWLRVVEIDKDAFMVSKTPAHGLASVRVHYPFQAAGIIGRYRSPNDPDAPPASKDDAYIEAKGDELQPDQIGGPYSGAQGLGQQAAYLKTVRPFRRIVSGQGVYRREAFSAIP